MKNCIIVDDEPLAVQLIESYVRKVDWLNTVNTFSNSLKALQFIQSSQVDLIFLDIQMPDLNGVQLAKLLDKKTKIIFTTAYPNYALEGFELEALDYLLKPISFERFLAAINRVIKDVAFTSKKENTASIFVKTEHRLQQIKLEEVLFIKGMGDYSNIQLEEKKILTLENMSSLTKRLPETFTRVHRSYIVPMNRVEFIERNRIRIGQELIPIGETYKDEFYKRIE